jgi:hypothetical protein
MDKMWKNMRVMRNTLKFLLSKSERKKQLRIPKHVWRDNIKIVLREIGHDNEYSNKPSGSRKIGKFVIH